MGAASVLGWGWDGEDSAGGAEGGMGGRRRGRQQFLTPRGVGPGARRGKKKAGDEAPAERTDKGGGVSVHRGCRHGGRGASVRLCELPAGSQVGAPNPISGRRGS